MGDSPVIPTDRGPNGRRFNPVTSLSLLARLRARDGDGWRECLTLYTPLVVRWCFRQGLGEADAADVAQEVFGKVAGHVEQFHKDAAGGSFRGWLCRITHHEITNFFRLRSGAVTPTGGTDAHRRLEQIPDRPVAEPDRDDALQETRYIYQKAVQAARTEFPDRVWQLFWRLAVDGHAAPQVAAEFGMTPAAVRQTKSRVLRRLKQLVGDVPD